MIHTVLQQNNFPIDINDIKFADVCNFRGEWATFFFIIQFKVISKIFRLYQTVMTIKSIGETGAIQSQKKKNAEFTDHTTFYS